MTMRRWKDDDEDHGSNSGRAVALPCLVAIFRGGRGDGRQSMRSLSPNQTPTSSPFLLSSSQNRKDQKKVQKLEAQIPYHEGYVVLTGSYWRV